MNNKRFNAALNGDSYVNVPATRMEVDDNMLYVWNGDELVALLDVGVVLSAHISEVGSLRGASAD